MITIAAIFFEFICFFGFIWSSFFFFKKSSEKNIYIFLIKAIGTLLIFTNIYFTWTKTNSNTAHDLIGVFFLVISSILFYWSIYTNRKRPLNFAFTEIEKITLISNGPYKYIRHPFYSSYIFAWVGSIVINQNIWLIIPSVIIIFFYYKSATTEEFGFLEGPIKTEYQRYMLLTGRFFPKITPLFKPNN